MKYFGIGALVLVGLVLVYSLGYAVYQNYFLEKPEYNVTDVFENFEIREYESYIVAKVEVDETGRSGLNSGFEALADYIFGNNTSMNSNQSEKISMTSPVIDKDQSEKISMTSPVINSQTSEDIKMTAPVIDNNESEEISMTSPVADKNEDGKRYVSFVMPSKYTMETLPKPNNTEVIIEKVENPRFAVATVRGSSDDSKLEKALQKMREELKKEDIEFDESEYSFAYYDPPFTPWFLKRNEVLIDLSE